MKILTRYIIREFLKLYAFALGSFLGIYIIVDLFEKLDQYIKYNAPVSLIIAIILCKIPYILLQITPGAVLLATFLALALRARHNEIIALKAAGIGTYRFFHPLIACSLVIWLMLLINQEFLIPVTYQKARFLENIKMKKKEETKLFKHQRFWYKSGALIYNIKLFDPKNNLLKGIAIYSFSPEFVLEKRIDAVEARWTGEQWQFSDVIIREFNPDGSIRSVTNRGKEKASWIKEEPEAFKLAKKESEEMGYWEYKEYTQKIRDDGYDPTPYLTDLHAKISFPFVAVVMSFLGIPFALRIGRSGNVAVGITTSMAIGFFYWLFFSFSLSLGKGGLLPPLVAAWSANIIFGAIAILILLQQRE
jgi:lipopolysaccharide export system permease protein